MPNFSSLSWFSFSSTVISCHQLLTAVESWWQLIWKKKLTGIFMYTLKLIPVPNFSSLGCFSFSSTFISCFQLLTADDSWYDKNFTGIFIYTLKLLLVLNSSSPGWFSFSSTVISCLQLLTSVQGWWQLTWKKIYWNFNALTKFNTCAKFQLSRFIFIFINCYQLL